MFGTCLHFLHIDCFLLLQVLNVSVEDGAEVFLEDLGGSVPSILANSSMLSKGLVLRSSSNQISVRFSSEQANRAGLLLLRYRGDQFKSFLKQKIFYIAKILYQNCAKEYCF